MIDSCICYQKTFEEIKDESVNRGLVTIEDIARELKCSTACGLCIPYIEAMLETGKTKFHAGTTNATRP